MSGIEVSVILNIQKHQFYSERLALHDFDLESCDESLGVLECQSK